MALVQYESVITFICAGQLAQIVQHWQTDDGDLSSNPFLDAKDLADALELNAAGANTPYFDVIGGILADDAFISSIRTRRVAPAGGPTYLKVFSSGDYTGWYGENLEAFQTAAVAIWIPTSDDAAHGRTFYPGVPSGVLEGNKFVGAFKTAFGNLIVSVMDGYSANTAIWSMVLQRGTAPSHTYVAIFDGQLSPTPGSIGKRRVPV